MELRDKINMQKNSFNNNVQEPALNESGEEAKRRGF